MADRSCSASRVLLSAVALMLVFSSPARAEIDFKIGGLISSDMRYRFAGEEVASPYPSQYKLLKYGFSRNENQLKVQASMSIADKIKAVGDVDLYVYGYSDVPNLDSLTLREHVDPYRLEINAAYIDIYQVFKGFDLRLGRQVVVWGAADKFNPTSNMSTLDLSDPLLFGKALANNMIRADYNPKGDWVISAIITPIFRPAQLPRTAPVALTDPERPAPIQEDAIRMTLGQLAAAMPPTKIDVLTMQPEPSIQNVQFAARVAGRVLNQDVSVSYYRGRFGIPVPAMSIQHVGGLNEVGLYWPRVDILGADIAGTIPKLGGLGYWVEAAVNFPEKVEFALYNHLGGYAEERFDPMTGKRETVRINGETYANGFPANYQRGTVIPSTPFLKLTAGADISIGRYVYINFQYVHGFIDEFGAGKIIRPPVDRNSLPRVEQRLGDYLVAGLDLKLANDTILLRLFGAFKVPSIDLSTGQFDDPAFTAVIFPQLSFFVWDATEISLGAFVFLGDRSTKFGDPAAGAPEAFLKAKFTF